MAKSSPNPSWNRIKRVLPRGNDPTLVILKGHLLIEEQLSRLIASHCCKPTRLEGARLSFAQQVKLADGLSGCLSGSGFPLLTSLEKLNAVRNRMAHHADVPDLNQRVDEYLRSWDAADFRPPSGQRERIRWLRNTLIIQIGLLSGFGRASESMNLAPNLPKT